VAAEELAVEERGAAEADTAAVEPLAETSVPIVGVTVPDRVRSWELAADAVDDPALAAADAPTEPDGSREDDEVAPASVGVCVAAAGRVLEGVGS
jgi:hypothetical protein